jgi:hypothetical protein
MIETNGHTPTHRLSVRKDDPLDAAPHLILELLADGKAVRVLVERDGLRGELTVGPIVAASRQSQTVEALPPPTPAPNPNWLWLSNIEAEVIRTFEQSSEVWIACERVAEVVSPISARDLGVIMRNMVKRGILQSQQGKGFRMAKSEGQS